MNECQIVVGFLLPPRQQAAGSIGPAMGSFHHPASRSSGLVMRLFVGAALGCMGLVSAAFGESLNRLANITFIQTEMLPPPSVRTRPADGDRVQCFGNQLLIVRIRAGNGNAQRHAAGVSEHGPLDAEFAAIGRVFPGFFPHPAATWSSPRPNSAIAIRYLFADRTYEGKPSIVVGRRLARSIPESNGAPCSASRTRVAKPSTDNLCAVGKRYRWPQPANSREVARHCGSRDTWAATAPSSAITLPVSAKTYPANPVAYTPPCLEPEHSSSGSTHKVDVCSVMG